MKVMTRGKCVGNYEPLTATYTKKVDRSKHFLWHLKSWGFDAQLLEALDAQGCTTIELHVKGEGKIHVGLGHAIASGVYKDFGHGMQVFVRQNLFIHE